MTDLSRRSFLRGALSVPAICVLPPTLLLPTYPVLYGDGAHDDADALNALCRGDSIQVEAEGVKASSAWLSGGRFLIGKPIVIAKDNHFTVSHCLFARSKDFEGDSYIKIIGSARAQFLRCCFEAEPNAPPIKHLFWHESPRGMISVTGFYIEDYPSFGRGAIMGDL